MKHVSGRLQPPRDVNPEVPEELDAVVVRLLARDPEDRYRDAAEVIKDLERVQRGEHPAMAATQQLEQQAPSPATTPPEDDKRRRWRWIPIPLILLLLALLGGTAYAFGPWRTAPEAPVPNLVGASSIEEARQMAGDRFEVVEGDRVESREAVGTVVGQSPYAGEMADEGSEISVDVVGTRIAEVPDVEGASRAEAERTLEEAGFEVTVETKESSAANENLVTGQDSQGETAEVGSTITITVGKGPAKIEVPSINNQALGGTEQVLAEAGLKLGNQTVAPSVRVPAGHIVEQRPAAGTGVEPGSTVDVVVSSGPQQLPSSNGDDDASQTVGSTAPASTAPASAAPALRADDEDEIGHEDEIGDEDRDEYRDDDYDERENEGRERD